MFFIRIIHSLSIFTQGRYPSVFAVIELKAAIASTEDNRFHVIKCTDLLIPQAFPIEFLFL